MQVGIPEERIAVIENGQVVEFENEAMHIGERIPGGYVFVDGSGVGDVGPAVVREREVLAQDGFVLVNLTLDRNTCHLVEEPEIITRGFVYAREAEELLESTRQIVRQAVNCASNGRMQSDLEQTLKSFLYSKTKRRPMVFVSMSKL